MGKIIDWYEWVSECKWFRFQCFILAFYYWGTSPQPGHEIRTATPTVVEATGLRSKKAQESRRALDTWRKRGVTEERTVKGIHSHLSSFKLSHLTQSSFIFIWVKTRVVHATLWFLTYWTLRGQAPKWDPCPSPRCPALALGDSDPRHFVNEPLALTLSFTLAGFLKASV